MVEIKGGGVVMTLVKKKKSERTSLGLSEWLAADFDCVVELSCRFGWLRFTGVT